jgi:hypothetical protein
MPGSSPSCGRAVLSSRRQSVSPLGARARLPHSVPPGGRDSCATISKRGILGGQGENPGKTPNSPNPRDSSRFLTIMASCATVFGDIA